MESQPPEKKVNWRFGPKTRNALKAVGRLVAVLIGVGSVVGITSYFGWEPLKDKPLGLLIIFSIGLNIWLVVELVLHGQKRVVVVQDRSRSLPAVLIDELEHLAGEGEYEAILRHRKSFSRSLWVEGKPSERVRLGEIAYEAALVVGDKSAQAAIQLDDLGWSLVSLKQYERAQQCLAHGLRIAQEIENYYLIAKAHRHKAGLFAEAKEYEKAKAELETAQQVATNIAEKRRKSEMLAGVAYGKAVIALLAGEPSRALGILDNSKELRGDTADKSRMVKVYSLKGKIAESMNDWAMARDYYRMGLEEAKRIGRQDEMIRNYRGLARIYESEDKLDQARSYRGKADKLSQSTPVPYEVEDSEAQLRKLT